jgi:hypothetical protein
MRNSISVFLHAGGVSRVPVRRPGRTVCMYIYTPILRALLTTQRTKILLS